jgi:hypothetical protein
LKQQGTKWQDTYANNADCTSDAMARHQHGASVMQNGIKASLQEGAAPIYDSEGITKDAKCQTTASSDHTSATIPRDCQAVVCGLAGCTADPGFVHQCDRQCHDQNKECLDKTNIQVRDALLECPHHDATAATTINCSASTTKQSQLRGIRQRETPKTRNVASRKKPHVFTLTWFYSYTVNRCCGMHLQHTSQSVPMLFSSDLSRSAKQS